MAHDPQTQNDTIKPIPLPPAPPQLQPTAQGSSPSHPSKRRKITNWSIFTLLIALIPLAILVVYIDTHGQTPTWVEIFKNGELIAISIAILGETLGELNLNQRAPQLLKNGLMIAIGFIGVFACIELSSFIALANCHDHYAADASKICLPLNIPADKIIQYSILFFVLSLTLGLWSKVLEG